jgi:hypothetical protein
MSSTTTIKICKSLVFKTLTCPEFIEYLGIRDILKLSCLSSEFRYFCKSDEIIKSIFSKKLDKDLVYILQFFNYRGKLGVELNILSPMASIINTSLELVFTYSSSKKEISVLI